MKSLFYRPDDGVAADFIPFFEDGAFHLFYLKDYRDAEKHGEGTPWFHIATKNFMEFEEYGEALPRGAADDQDLWVFTGSVIRAEGTYHIFYTGHNSHYPEKAKPTQAVMHAVSADLVSWTKVPEDTFYADPTAYEVDDFRDPFVFFDGETGKYGMLLVSRKKNCGLTAGFTALYTSEDLKHWTDSGVFWGPDLYHTHECPDLFRIGSWWYMAYSEYSDRSLTRYIMARDKNGPWIIPPDDAFDGRAYYAAKTSGDGENRYLFGWIPTREGGADRGGWQWGGNLAVHQLIQRENGTLGCRLPDSIASRFRETEVLPCPIILANPGGRTDRRLFTQDGPLLLRASLKFSEGTRHFGITLNQDFESKYGYKYEFSVHENTVRFDSVTDGANVQNMSRPLALRPGEELRITLLADGDIAVLYVNGEVALSSRMYNIKGRDISAYVVGGSLEVNNAHLAIL